MHRSVELAVRSHRDVFRADLTSGIDHAQTGQACVWRESAGVALRLLRGPRHGLRGNGPETEIGSGRYQHECRYTGDLANDRPPNAMPHQLDNDNARRRPERHSNSQQRPFAAMRAGRFKQNQRDPTRALRQIKLPRQIANEVTSVVGTHAPFAASRRSDSYRE